MPLEPIKRLIQAAGRGDYAVGYFESWNLDSLQGVIDAAEETRSPIIIGFNGEFLSQRAGATPDELPLYGALGRAAAEKATVPCGLIFNECSKEPWLERAITSGFNLIMPADPGAGPGDYTRRVKRLASVAHAKGVAIEAEVEKSTTDDEEDESTGPAAAAKFVDATGIDLLAVHVGNEEIKLEGRGPLDLARLESIRGRVSVPFVLHGGSGIEDDSLRAAIRLGVRKVNYGTYMKQRYLKALREALSSSEANPHALLGDGGPKDVLVVGRSVIRNAVLERIELLGCCGRA
jgi:fructose/tagatose bisphosphate aldolase